jgi:hypothetical protein
MRWGAARTAAALALLYLVGACATQRPPMSPALPAGVVPLGAFLGVDQSGVAATDRFASWLGVRLTVGRTYLPGGSWRDIEGTDEVLEPWAAWRRERADRVLALNVPMVAPNEPPMVDRQAATALRAGADGQYDPHFRRLAQRLVELGAADTVLVLGWEMNGTTYSSRCAPDPQAWKEYWRRIVAAMRAVPGQRFRFDFAPVRGAQAVPWPDCYPGDDVVDIVGMDSYDQAPGRSFDDFVRQPYGLQAQADFAAHHGKPMSYPEWGLFEYGDDPDYVRRMHAWLLSHRVAYHSLTDYCPHGVWGCLANPASTKAFRQLFGVGEGT